ncbi:Ras-related protein RABB1b [Vanrija pseudolonga]|uniref:Ras-related protein RABB1b n=1 Tax=Vanrija pseudolonga TaxID=143232 RepID=A0AAF0Y489_9TREE|nr:Ras-related protein RABB1b [Vanrija pseudolonga]
MDQLTCILKYVIVGDAAVGKSCLLVRLTDDRFSASEPTLGVEFGSRILSVGENGKRVKVQCWDTAGTESFRSITRSYFRGAAGALLVYDVTRRETFEHATSWLDDLRAHADENVSIILVANKTDLCSAEPTAVPQIQYGVAIPHAVDDDAPAATPEAIAAAAKLRPRAVSTIEGALFAKEHNLLYVETSAKEGWGVVDAFEWTARQILERVERGEFERRKPSGVKLDSAKSKGGCC